MPPNIDLLREQTSLVGGPKESSRPAHRPRIVWVNVVAIIVLHILAVYALVFRFYQLRLVSILYGFAIGIAGGFGVSGGAHRFWSHRSFKAKLPLKLILLLCYSIAGQHSIFTWVRDHRVHHKYCETDADPHNASRGFFFSHVGWLMQRKHPEVLRRGAKIDMSDLLADPLVMFHTKYFTIMKITFCFILPTVVPIYCWGEDVTNTILVLCIFRYMLNLNLTWLVNSVAHIYGNRPYNKAIGPTDNLMVSIMALGDGGHNYHHTFPWDYRDSELGGKVNVTTFLIECFAKIGWAYDLKTASPTLVKDVLERHGDGSHQSLHNHEDDQEHRHEE